MELHAHTLVSALLGRYPFVEDVLASHDVRLDDTLRSMSLYAVCWIRGIELDRLLDEVQQVIDLEDDPTEEVAGFEDSRRFAAK